MELSKKEIILKLISAEKYPEAFNELDLLIPKDKKLEYEAFVNEYVHPSADINWMQYKQRLTVFVSRSIKVEKKPMDTEPDFYDALCSLDFTLQTDHYTSIIPYKPLVAFLAHGNTDKDGNDINWLSKQLLHRERKQRQQQGPVPEDDERVDDIITIDCETFRSVETIFEQLFDKYKINVGNYDQLRHQLGSKLRDKLSHGHVVCIMKNVQDIFTDDNRLSALFKDLLVFLNAHIVRINHENSLIFLFAHNGEAKCQPQNRDYFFWLGDSQDDPHAVAAVGCDSQRIIDLGPINHLQSADVKTWINASFGRPKVYEKVKQLKGKEAAMIGNGPTARPFEVIKNICTCLDIKFEDKWIN